MLFLVALEHGGGKAAKYTVNFQAMVEQPKPPIEAETSEATIPYDAVGKRLDQVLVDLFPQHTRSRLQQLLKSGAISVDDQRPKASTKVRGGELIRLIFTPEPRTQAQPQAIDLDVVFEDEHLMVVNKPPGLVVHPGAGNPDRTLENALLHHNASLSALPRAGLVHRIDKDTTGLLMIGKTEASYNHLVAQLEERSFKRLYQAVCVGVMTAGGTVDAPIGRHPVDRKRMAIRDDGRASVTHYRVRERFYQHTHVQLQLETGRTHQIRVHMQHIRYPLVGDPVYGQRLNIPSQATEALRVALTGFKRQALHAATLGVTHPQMGEPMEWTVPPPRDLQELIVTLEKDQATRQ